MKKLLWIIPLALILLFISAIVYVKTALPNVGPAPAIRVEITPEKTARGEYLANVVMGCVDCHSERDFSRFAGPVTGTPFAGGGAEFTVELGSPGDFYAPNLTPFHLADWTDGEIYRAITAGVSKDGRALFPAMPSHLYGQLANDDIYALIAYLRTLPAVEKTVPEPKPKFPFGIIMNFIPKKQTPGTSPDTQNKVEYGKYLVTMAACFDCHTAMEKGQYVMTDAFAGNREFIMPTGIVRSANISPDKTTGIGSWTEDFFIQRFKVYADSSFVLPTITEGFNTIMPWMGYAHLDENELSAIFAYLQTLPPVNKEVVKFSVN